MSTLLTKIPVIDFEPFIQGDVTQQEAIARQIYQACHEIGFMYLKNLGISNILLHQAFAQTQQFFNLPSVVKEQLAWTTATINRGYVGVERERLKPDSPGDLKEAFNVGNEDSQSVLIVNQWPVGHDDFRQTILEFYQACTEATCQIFQAFAIALHLPKSFILDKHRDHNHTLRLLHYPPLTQTPKLGQVRAGEHSDYGSITLLFQDEVGGLEVRTAQGEWIAAPYIPDTVIVNTGDLMQRWTNHIFCSTQHRVLIADAEQIKRSRYSIAFFCQPDSEAEISCLETCKEPNCPPLYPPITAGDYLLSRLQVTY